MARRLAPILLPLLLVATVTAGCTMPGESRLFPDESDLVRKLHVNAYQASDQPQFALVEISGLGADGEAHAFSGEIRLVLERQEGTEQVTYAFVKEWRLSLDADDFASPTTAHHVVRIPASDFPDDGTYRASVSGSVRGRDVEPHSSLFSFHRPN